MADLGFGPAAKLVMIWMILFPLLVDTFRSFVMSSVDALVELAILWVVLYWDW